MNCEQVDLDAIEVERFQVKEVLKALLHSIIFQRALGAPAFRDTDSTLFDLSYVRSDSRVIDARVEDQTDAFNKALERDETTAAHQVCISFFERRTRPSTFSLFRSEEKVVWERWIIPLVVHARDPDLNAQVERAERSRALEETLRERIEFVVSMASGKKEHIPPVDGLGSDTPWFDITWESSSSWASSGLDIFKTILSSPPLISGPASVQPVKPPKVGPFGGPRYEIPPKPCRVAFFLHHTGSELYRYSSTAVHIPYSGTGIAVAAHALPTLMPKVGFAGDYCTSSNFVQLYGTAVLTVARRVHRICMCISHTNPGLSISRIPICMDKFPPLSHCVVISGCG